MHQSGAGGAAREAAPGVDALMFELAPISLWLQDLSELKALFAEWRNAGVTSLAGLLREDPARVKLCWDKCRVIKINRRTLELFEAADLQQLVDNQAQIFREDTFDAY